MTANTETTAEDMVTREYECGYLLLPTIPDEKMSGEVERIKRTLTDHGAELANEQAPTRMPLAYTMTLSREGERDHYTEGAFGWITFEASSDQVNAMKEELRGNDAILRYMIIRADKDQEPVSDEGEVEEGEENAEESEAETGADVEAASADPAAVEQEQTEKTEAASASEKEIDKSIDNLVGEDQHSSNA